MQKIGSQSWKGWESWDILIPHPIRLVMLVFKAKWLNHHLLIKWQESRICWKSYMGCMCTILEMARGGFYYIITFIDSLSRFRYLFLREQKWILWIVQGIQSPNREPNWEKYWNSKIRSKSTIIKYLVYLVPKGTWHCIITHTAWNTLDELVCQKGRICTLLDIVQSIMGYNDLPISLWGWELQIAWYTI